MKILFLATACPFGPTLGMGHRTRNIAFNLKEIGDLSMIAIGRRPWPDDAIEETRQHFNLLRYMTPVATTNTPWRKLRSTFDPTFLDTQLSRLDGLDQRFLDEAVAHSDVVWIHTLKIANIAGHYRWANSVLDADDFSSNFNLSVARNARSRKEKYDRLRRSWMWKRRESHILKRFTSAVVCKEEDRNAFKAPDRTHVVANGFGALPSAKKQTVNELPRLGMIGTFDYLLNTEAIEWFLSSCWDKVRAESPACELRLVGKSSEKYNDPERGVLGLGFVDDPAKEMSSWNAMVVPTRMGGGTSVKVAEAFAREIPVVATAHGRRGYHLEHGEGLLVADQPADFVAQCLRLLTDQALADKLTANAKRYFQQNLSTDSMLPGIEAAVRQALAEPAPTDFPKI